MAKSEIFGTNKPPTTNYRTVADGIKDHAARTAIKSVGAALEALIVVLQQYVVDQRVAGATGIPTPINSDRVGLENSTQTTVADDTQVYLSWDTELYDPSDLHISGSPTRVTVKNPGHYLIIGQVTYANCGVADKSHFLLINVGSIGGASVKIAQGQTTSDGALATTVEVITMKPLVAGDFIEMVAFQKSGVSLNTAGTGFKFNGFSVARLA